MDERRDDPDRQLAGGDGETLPHQPRRAPARHDPAAPHTAPFPDHIPRWLAWLVLIALAASGVMCVRMAVG